MDDKAWKMDAKVQVRRQSWDRFGRHDGRRTNRTKRNDTTQDVRVQLCMYQYTMLSPTAPRRRTYDDSEKQHAKITHGSAKAKNEHEEREAIDVPYTHGSRRRDSSGGSTRSPRAKRGFRGPKLRRTLRLPTRAHSRDGATRVATCRTPVGQRDVV